MNGQQEKPKLPVPVRGDVFKARLDPIEGHEKAGDRPVIVVSRNSLNSASPVIVVVPATDAANVKRQYPSHTLIPKGEGGMKMDTIAQAEQIRAIDKGERFLEYWGRLNELLMSRIDIAIKNTLALK